MGALGTAPIPPLHLFALTNHMTCKIHIEQPKGEGLACKRNQSELGHSGHSLWSTQLHTADKTSRITPLGSVVLLPSWLAGAYSCLGQDAPAVIQCLLQRGPDPSCIGLFRHFYIFTKGTKKLNRKRLWFGQSDEIFKSSIS